MLHINFQGIDGRNVESHRIELTIKLFSVVVVFLTLSFWAFQIATGHVHTCIHHL